VTRQKTPPRITVVGSANLDQVLTVDRAPGPGETVSSSAYAEESGGKGLNQALAAARTGAAVRFVGAVGGDDAGHLVRRALRDAGIDDSTLRATTDPTGRALIVVDADRENRIVLLGGANHGVVSLGADDRAAITSADAVLLQLELPLEVVAEAAHAAAEAGVLVALTPAPAQPLPPALLADVSILFANEHETAELTGVDDPEAAVAALLDLVPAVVVTRGAAGSDHADRTGRRHHQPAVPVTAVDTTGAGDVYAGVFVTAYAGGSGVEAAMERAARAASIAVGRRGTSSSIPTTADLD